MNEDLIREEMHEIHQINTKLAVLGEQFVFLVQQMTEMRSDIKEIKEIQSEKISTLEKEVALLRDKVDRMEWFYKVIGGVSVTAIVGAILSLVMKSN